MKKAYAKAGVDVDLGNRVKAGIHQQVKSTHGPEVLGKIGGFGGLFRPNFRSYRDPILVSSIDGVGTKLKVAEMAGRHDTIGEDLVNHCVNDIAVIGARPLFFLDYIGTAKLDPSRFREILSGLVRGCKAAGCALIGGETAQMPGLYHGKDYDLVGGIVGVVDRKKLIDGRTIKPGDVILGLPSSGLHTNGYSLARKLIFDDLKLKIHSKFPGTNRTVADVLLSPHINYLPVLENLRKRIPIKGLAHITGGGLLDNLPRILPINVNAVIHLGSWMLSPLFSVLADASGSPAEELYQTFNMGIGMAVIVSSRDADHAAKLIKARKIGVITKGAGRVTLENLYE